MYLHPILKHSRRAGPLQARAPQAGVQLLAPVTCETRVVCGVTATVMGSARVTACVCACVYVYVMCACVCEVLMYARVSLCVRVCT